MLRSEQLQKRIDKLTNDQQTNFALIKKAGNELETLKKKYKKTEKKKKRSEIKGRIDEKNNELGHLVEVRNGIAKQLPIAREELKNLKDSESKLDAKIRKEKIESDAKIREEKKLSASAARYPAPQSLVGLSDRATISLLQDPNDDPDFASDLSSFENLQRVYGCLYSSVAEIQNFIQKAASEDEIRIISPALKTESELLAKLIEYTNRKYNSNLSPYPHATQYSIESIPHFSSFSPDMTPAAFEKKAEELTKQARVTLAERLSSDVRHTQNLFKHCYSVASDKKTHQQILASLNDKKAVLEMLRKYEWNKDISEVVKAKQDSKNAHLALVARINELETRDNLTPAQENLLIAGRLLADSNEHHDDYSYRHAICTAAKNVLDSETPETFNESLTAYQEVMAKNKLGKKADYTSTAVAASVVFLGAAALLAGLCLAATLIFLPIGIALTLLGITALAISIPMTVIEARSAPASGNQYVLPRFYQNACSASMFAPKAAAALDAPENNLSPAPAHN